ncbi:hypothetical protein JXB37_04785 [candidate division WOR-3 bacterium]|nr:hypothetical protein [candidate division WOR-3 bacterium]
MKIVFLLVAALVAAVPGRAAAQELIRNGRFEDSLDYWTVEYNNAQGSWEVSAGPDYHPDPDNELYVMKSYQYYARARQAASVSSTELLFAGSARLAAMTGGTSGYYAYATLALEYQDAGGVLLGRTMFIHKAGSCTLATTPTQHVVEVDSGVWNDFELLVDAELDGLPGINRNDIARVAVVLESYGTGRTG